MRAKYRLLTLVFLYEVPFYETAVILQLVHHSAESSHFKLALLEAFSAFSHLSIKNDYLSSTRVNLPRSQLILERTT